jgi:hypothetical protein
VVLKHVRTVAILTAFVLCLGVPSSSHAQSLEAISELEIGLVGMTVDIETGQFLGRGCYWNGSGRCSVSLSTLRNSGVPVFEGTGISLSEGFFGHERYRLSGRITSLSFDGTTSSVFNRGHTVQSPQEVIVDLDGKVLSRPRPRSNDMWGRNAVRVAQVRAHVTWSLYDTEASSIVVTREVKGLSDDMGNAIYNSLERFVDYASDEIARSEQ